MADEEPIDEMVTIGTYPSERVARETAKALLEHGVGSVIRPRVPEPSPAGDEIADATGPSADTVPGPSAEQLPGGARASRNTDEYAASFELRVMRHQVVTACEVLDVGLPDETRAEIEERESAPKPTPWKRILVIWAIAMIVVPIVSGYLTYLLLSR